MISLVEAIAMDRAEEQVSEVESVVSVERDPWALVEMRHGKWRQRGQPKRRPRVPCIRCSVRPARSRGLCYQCNKDDRGVE